MASTCCEPGASCQTPSGSAQTWLCLAMLETVSNLYLVRHRAKYFDPTYLVSNS